MAKKVFLLFFSLYLLLPLGIYAAENDNVWGWAWSGNIGWVSFNCKDGGEGGSDVCSSDNSNYGMNINEDGYVEADSWIWSKNIGWITFDPKIAGNPPVSEDDFSSEGYLAKVKSGALLGWARAIAGCKDSNWDTTEKKCTGSGPGDRTGNWDGWIRFSEVVQGGEGFVYGVRLGDGEFTGWAWGKDIVGWLSLNCKTGPDYASICSDSNYAVKTSFKERVTPKAAPLESEVDYCQKIVSLSWTYIGSLPCAKYQILIAPDDGTVDLISEENHDDENIIKIAGTCSAAEGEMINTTFNMINAGGSGKNLEFNKFYVWVVKLEDSQGHQSINPYILGFLDIGQSGPTVDIKVSPDFLTSQSEMSFDGTNSICSGQAGDCQSYEWKIEPEDGHWALRPDDPATEEINEASKLTDSVVYANFDDESKTYNVTLKVNDNGKTCSKTVVLENSILKWEERPPFLYFKGAFQASVRKAAELVASLLFR